MMLTYCILLLCCSYVLCEYIDLPEGSPCSWKNVTGLCVSVYRCFNAMEDIKNKDHPPICTYKDEVPIICCTDCKLVNDTRLITVHRNVGILEKTGTSRAKDKCIDYINSVDYFCKRIRIVGVYKEYNNASKCYDVGIQRVEAAIEGGRIAFRDKYGHMALLGYGDTVESAQWLCGGSVISERFILTAGHCLSSRRLGPVKYITLGILRRTDTPDIWQRYNVQRAIPHPEYKPPSKYHDIALLETDQQITFGRRVRPACLHVDGEEDDVAEAAGWGALGYKKSLADTLQSVTLHKFSEEQCSMEYPEHRHLKHGYNHTTQLCYGNLLEAKDTCEGDSGGPLQSDRDDCVYKILGVTSYGRRCGLGSSSGIYTRVAYYVPWMEDIVWP